MTAISIPVPGGATNISPPLREAAGAAKRLRECSIVLRKLVRQALPEVRTNPVAAWLVENHSYLQFQIRETRRSLPAAYLRDLPKIGRGDSIELRVYSLASRFAARLAGDIDAAAVSGFAVELKKDESLMLGELWAFGSMLKLALIECLCGHPESEQIVSRAIRSLRALDHVNWCDFVESVSTVESILQEDPAAIYSAMDFATRDRYRHQVEGMARRSDLSEKEVAERAIARAAAASSSDRARHVGYHLIGPGLASLRRVLGYRPFVLEHLQEFMERWPSLFYVGAAALLTAAVLALFRWLAGPLEWWWMLTLLLVPASQAALEIVNAVASRVLPPRSLPSMDFSEGIPADCQTLVVVPTLLLSPENVSRLLEDLEIRYLANREPNLYFALLTDLPDATLPETPDDAVLSLCAEGIKRLNARYASTRPGPFYLFHRRRLWNQSQSRWMGYERKRGKLNDLNRFLLGRGNGFEAVIGETESLHKIRYVITLDTDTQLPRDAAAKMVAAAAHPLNQPVFDPQTGMVKEGFTVICPRVTTSMESAASSRLAQIFSGQTGFDPYATAVSNVYQDLHNQASFIGKGIYDLRAFDAAAGSRFPENAILSHDLIEGEFARTALLTSVELVENYPATYEGFSKRKHRWVRGDWQLLPWLFPWTLGPGRQWVRNQLPFLSRWKIFDNLRRSLLEISVLLLFFAGWWTAENPLRWTLAVVALLLCGAYADLLLTVVAVPERPMWPAFLSHLGERFLEIHRVALLNLALIPHQACVMADAVIRTLIRRLITGRNLLEWEPMAQADLARGPEIGMVQLSLAVAALVALLAMIAWAHASAAVALLCAVWTGTPLLVRCLNAPPREPAALSESDRAFLRRVALRTWRFFTDQCDASNHWLAPDHVQEDPPLAAHRASPTNIGLLLNAQLAAADFGYLTFEELSRSLQQVFPAIEKMPRYRGHLFNWYDTRTLQPEWPRFVSTVDSGNLAASLCTLRQGCLTLLNQPILRPAILEGLRDHVLRLREELPYCARSGSLMRMFAALLRQLDSRPTDLFFWEAVLTEVRDIVQRIRESLLPIHAELLEQGDRDRSEQLRYWESLLSERINAALNELYGIAPWLDPSLEPELRLNTRDASLARLVADFCAVPTIADLPVIYERIRVNLIERLRVPDPLYPVLRRTLEQLRDRLPDARAAALDLTRSLNNIAQRAARLFDAMDFRFLFDRQRKLLRIGYDLETGCLDESCYDLLASEARTAVFLAIAKGDIPREAWFRLGRKLTAYRGRRTLLSWNGTMFEYLMPLLHMRSYSNTLLDRAVRGAVEAQRLYAAERNVPWGISESAHTARVEHRYQYRAFGIPHLSVHSHRAENLVLAPYASTLALLIDPGAATSNLRLLTSIACLGRYGFYDAIDYSRDAHAGELVRCFMAHHQGMSLLAIDNALNGNPMQERFHLEPLVQAAEFLLQERMPALVEVLNEDEDAAA